jgi:hypothetical protein
MNDLRTSLIFLRTGLNMNISKQQGDAIGIRTLVYKPVAKSKLAAAIRRVLNGCPVKCHLAERA